MTPFIHSFIFGNYFIMFKGLSLDSILETLGMRQKYTMDGMSFHFKHYTHTGMFWGGRRKPTECNHDNCHTLRRMLQEE